MKGRIQNRPVGTEKRREQRRALFLSAEAAQDGATSPVEILDLSASGLLISTSSPLVLDEPLSIVLADGVEREARIVWQAGRLHGCRFSDTLSTGELSANLLRAYPPREEPNNGRDTDPAGRETLGQRLRRLRVRSPHTMTELARLAGVTKPTLWKWETGKSRPRHDSLARLAAALGVDEVELAYGSSGPDAEPTDGPIRQNPDQTSLARLVAEARERIAAKAGVAAAQVSITINFS